MSSFEIKTLSFGHGEGVAVALYITRGTTERNLAAVKILDGS